MAHSAPLISTLVFGLVLAFGFGLIAQRLKLPPLIGYLLAGIAIGPFTPGFRCRSGRRQSARRNRRDPADVRCWLAFLARRPAFGPRHRHSRRSRPSRGRDAARHGRRLVAGLDAGRGPRLRHRAVGGEHRRAAAPACRSAGCSIPSGDASPSAGLSSRTSAWCSCWCCCRRSPACSRAPGMRRIRRSCSRPSPSRSARSPPSSSSCSSSAGR